jgi:predicted CXXCH cytochrome family protein
MAGRERTLRIAAALALVLGCADASRAPTYVDDAECAGCHPAQAEAWRGSHHDLAMQEARADTVLGDFEDARFDHHGVAYRFRREGERFVVETADADGTPGVFPVRYAFGVEPLQQVLLDYEGGRLQALPIAWDVERQRWFALYDEPTPPGDLLHWTSPLLNWNAMCADCHSTNVERGFDLEADRFETTFSAIDVGCQACHGPGSAHVETGQGGLPVAYDASDPQREIESCAPCHARRHAVSARPVPGEPLLDHFLPALLEEGLYHPDGQILDEVYVYGSFVQSRMYAAGVRCSDCHDPHSAALVADGNALCARCHRPDPPGRFATLRPGAYDAPSHHHHAPGGPGSACVDCHMPARTYMGIDARRDHQLAVPRPDLSQSLGTPNACTGCHDERSPAWAEAAVRRWFPDGRAGTPHFAGALAAGRRGEPEAIRLLQQLAADHGQPAIVRATALSLLRRQPGAASLEALIPAVDDGDARVRVAAVAGVGALLHASLPPGLQRSLSRPLVPRLEDDRRAVRMEAARALSAASPEVLDVPERALLEEALAEFTRVQEAQDHDPSAHLALAVLYAARGRIDDAEASYRTALRLQPAFLPARFNLATLYNAQGRNREAERELRAVLARAPDLPEAHYSLGLLLAEMQRLDEAERHLAAAADALPGRARVRYNHALALDRLGRREQAIEALERAAAVDPDDPDIARTRALWQSR